MKKLLILLLFPVVLHGQARLGKSEVNIRETLSDINVTRGWTKDGQKYLMASFDYGTFIYYFDKNGLSNFNIQIPRTIQDANVQAEIYNKKYVIKSSTLWTAYLDGGGIMNIEMIFDEELNTYIFKYSY